MRSIFCEIACFDNFFDCVYRDLIRANIVLFVSVMPMYQWSVMLSLWSFASNGFALRHSLLKIVYSAWLWVYLKSHHHLCPPHHLVASLKLRNFWNICHGRTYCYMSMRIHWYFVYDNQAAFVRSNPKHHDLLL